MSSAVVRVGQRTHLQLRQLSEDPHRSIGQIVGELVDNYERERFWQKMHAGFTSLRTDKDVWRAYQAETALWDSTAGDGLEHEDPYYTKEEEEEILAEFAKSLNR
jgi:hypothetical protein